MLQHYYEIKCYYTITQSPHCYMTFSRQGSVLKFSDNVQITNKYQCLIETNGNETLNFVHDVHIAIA